jgi:hypothetical protein
MECHKNSSKKNSETNLFFIVNKLRIFQLVLNIIEYKYIYLDKFIYIIMSEITILNLYINFFSSKLNIINNFYIQLNINLKFQ